MYFLSRWWDRYRLHLSLALLSLGVAWFIHQTQGAVLFEVYRWVTLPFQVDSTQQERLLKTRTWELQQRIIELEIQNRQLQTLTGQAVVAERKGIVTPVIGHSADHWWQQIILGHGRQDGVTINSVVVAPGGLVGRVTQVSDHVSRVLLITNPTSQIGVTVSRSRSMGLLRGRTGQQAIVEFFDKDPDVRPGDTIVTSSLSSLFPAGLIIGRVESLNLAKTSAPEAVIDLSAPISDLEWVTIYRHDQASRPMVPPNP